MKFNSIAFPVIYIFIFLTGGILGDSICKKKDGTSSSPGGTNYYYANWWCSGSQCAVVMGASKGSNGPFCTKAACEAWKKQYIPGSCNCETAPNTSPVRGTPPNGKCYP